MCVEGFRVEEAGAGPGAVPRGVWQRFKPPPAPAPTVYADPREPSVIDGGPATEARGRGPGQAQRQRSPSAGRSLQLLDANCAARGHCCRCRLARADTGADARLAVMAADTTGVHARLGVADALLSHQKQPTAGDIALARERLARRLAEHAAHGAHAAPPAAPPAPDQDMHAEDMDVLARATAHFSVLLQRAGAILEACQRSRLYRVLSSTTQPAHIVTFLSVALVAALLFPRQGQPTQDGAEPSPWTYLTYVVSFAAHFGSQFWMTFVSGLSLFFSLPRHHFAEVQKVLFPLYFGINAALSLLTLGTFVRLQPSGPHLWDAEVAVQAGGMVLCFLLELLVRLYLTPPLLALISAKTAMEKTVAGVGQEVGRYDLGPLTQCPHYVKIHRAFRRVHAGIAVANMTAMGCTALHAHYLAGKICI